MRKINLLILFVVIIVASFLRLWRLDKVPVSLFGDELDVGYHAYSVLKTGRDYSGNFMPLHFQSLAEWRTPLYLYSAVPTVGLFGINAWGVRLPAAVFGVLSVLIMYFLVKEMLGYKQPPVANHPRALLAALLMALSPWCLQYSRAGFEVTEMLFFLLLGLVFFFKSLEKGKWLWLSMVCFALTPWVYSTAKLFSPFLIIFLVVVWRKELFNLSKKYLIAAVIALVVVGGPIAYSTFFGGGTQRFGYISVFTDPATEPEVGVVRQLDARMRGELGEGLRPTYLDRLIHNKFTFWGTNIITNYFQSFSTDFLFVKGDSSLRHSIGIGEFYRVEFIALILGLIFFFTSTVDTRIKSLIVFWILVGAVPSAITREGGKHATRLILILPPLLFLMSYGIIETFRRLKGLRRLLVSGVYLTVFIISFFLYQHQYWVHYPWASERWWHAGYKESMEEIKRIDSNYSKVIISMSGEPAWVFFAGWSQYPPDLWHKGYPFKKAYLEGFGDISYIDKYYFGSVPADIGIYGLGKKITNKTLYLANAKEIGANLILEPNRTPSDLTLLKAIDYPSGEPAFYLFTGVDVSK